MSYVDFNALSKFKAKYDEFVKGVFRDGVYLEDGDKMPVYANVKNWQEDTSYSADSTVIKDGKLYQSKKFISASSGFVESDWTLIGSASEELPVATTSVLGGVKVGSGLSVTADGVLSTTEMGGGLTAWTPNHAYTAEKL